MSGSDQLHATLSDRACRLRFGFGPDFVDDDHFRSVVLNRLDHHGVLKVRTWHLHAAAGPDAGMRDVSVTGNLVRRIDDDHAFLHLRKTTGASPTRGC